MDDNVHRVLAPTAGSTTITPISTADAQPNPKVDYYGKSLYWMWKQSTIGNYPLKNNPYFADIPGWSSK